MPYVLAWFFVLSLLALWSFATWALHGIALWTVTNAGALGGAAAGTGPTALPDWLAAWVPPGLAQAATDLIAGVGPMVQALLQAAPALGGALGVAAGLVWGIGAVVLVMLGAGLHLLIAVWRRRGGGGNGGVAGPSASLAAG